MTAHLLAAKAPPAPDRLPSGCLELFGGPERTRIQKQRNPQAAATQLAAHMLLHYALDKVYGIDSRSFTVARTQQGKPYFTGPDAPQFSLSHSGATALCAVHDAPIGADVERIRPVTPALARRIMSDTEYDSFCRSDDKKGLFFKIWTLKESYLKQTGQGITCDLKALSFVVSGQDISFNNPDYTFRLYDLTDGYQACACVAHGTLPQSVDCIPMEELALSGR